MFYWPTDLTTLRTSFGLGLGGWRSLFSQTVSEVFEVSWVFGGKINKCFPGSTDQRLQFRLGSRTFSVSPNFALTARCDTLSDWVGHSDKVMPTHFSKVSHQGFWAKLLKWKMFGNLTSNVIFDRMVSRWFGLVSRRPTPPRDQTKPPAEHPIKDYDRG